MFLSDFFDKLGTLFELFAYLFQTIEENGSNTKCLIGPALLRETSRYMMLIKRTVFALSVRPD